MLVEQLVSMKLWPAILARSCRERHMHTLAFRGMRTGGMTEVDDVWLTKEVYEERKIVRGRITTG